MTYTATAAAVKIDGELVPIVALAQAVSVPDPIVRWDFEEAAAPFYSTDADLPLQVGVGSIASGHSGGSDILQRVSTPFGYGVQLGGQNWLVIDGDDIGRLNVGASTGQVTVAAWVLNSDSGGGAVAGIWREDSENPSRSYCLFFDLAYYNGNEKVCMHISKLGGATPGYPYAIEYSASAETIARGGSTWELYVGTYDGLHAVSYLNGVASTLTQDFTDVNGVLHTYPKNPYRHPDGLNAAPADFTVGAVELTDGMGNMVIGQIARLRVWDVALTPQQVQALYDSEAP